MRVLADDPFQSERGREIPMDGWVQLDNQKWLFKWFGKYKPNICLISNQPLNVESLWEQADPQQFNLSEGSLSIISGRFFVSKKGTRILDITGDTPHILIKDSWGGPFNKYGGGALPENQLYYRRASSSGGGMGNDYCIVDYGWKNIQSYEDL